MPARLPNRSFSVPQHGQDATFLTPESTVGFNREFQTDGSDWVPSGSRPPFPNAQGELPVFREFSMLVSGSAQASPAGVAGLAQPMEVRLGLGSRLIFLPALLRLFWPRRRGWRRMEIR